MALRRFLDRLGGAPLVLAAANGASAGAAATAAGALLPLRPAGGERLPLAATSASPAVHPCDVRVHTLGHGIVVERRPCTNEVHGLRTTFIFQSL